MLRELLEDRLINKLNGYFLILYANDDMKLATVVEIMNDALIFCLVHAHLISARRRLKFK